MITLLIYVLVLVLLFGVLAYAVRLLPLEPPWNQVALVVLAVVFVLAILNLFVPMIPGMPVLR
jgi:hypothetical protein